MRLFQAQKAWKQPFLLYISMFACVILNWKYKMKHKFLPLLGYLPGIIITIITNTIIRKPIIAGIRMIHIRMNERQLIRTVIGKLGENDR